MSSLSSRPLRSTPVRYDVAALQAYCGEMVGRRADRRFVGATLRQFEAAWPAPAATRAVQRDDPKRTTRRQFTTPPPERARRTRYSLSDLRDFLLG